MKITMIGDRGCGKTTFMAAVYRTMTTPDSSLNIRLSNREQRARVDAIAKKLSRGKFPSATSFEQEYKFDFTVDGVKLLDFSWYDYRGGALMEGKNSKEAAQLFDDIENSDGLLVFIDHTTLDDHRKWNKNSKYWRTIQQAVRQHAIQADDEHPRSLGIVLTKWDAEDQCKSPYPIIESVVELLSTLPNMDNICGIMAHTAVMKDTSINAIVVFLRLMMPFIFSALDDQAYKIKQSFKMNKLLNQINNNYNKAGIVDDIISRFWGKTSSRDKVIDCVNMLKSFPLYKSKSRKNLIDSFLYHWNNQSIFNDYGSTAEEEFCEIVNIWLKFANDVNSLFGDWKDNIMDFMREHNGMDKGAFVLF